MKSSHRPIIEENNMKPLLILILSLCFTLTAFGQKPEYPDSGFTNKAEAKNLYKDSLKEGKWIEYLNYLDYFVEVSKSDFYILTIYKQGKPYGIRRSYYKSGKLKEVTPYNNGCKNGISKEYFESGKISKLTPYTDGKINGVVKSYYENGKICAEIPFNTGIVNGMEKCYFKNGKLSIEIPFENGKEGVSKCYDIKGNVITCPKLEL
jgi:antitoxin component YwqK of YwqJK toxin-antitoxin module